MASQTATPSPLPQGLADPVLSSQAVFRATMDAMAHPGRLVAITERPEPPAPLDPAAAAVCLTLADVDAPIWLDDAAATDAVRRYLQFHTGAPIGATPEQAVFGVIAGAVPELTAFAQGSDAFPERSATRIIQVQGLSPDGPLTLRGPGIDGSRALGVDGPGADFWRDWRHNVARFPRGVDVVFAAHELICGLPRGIQVEV